MRLETRYKIHLFSHSGLRAAQLNEHCFYVAFRSVQFSILTILCCDLSLFWFQYRAALKDMLYVMKQEEETRGWPAVPRRYTVHTLIVYTPMYLCRSRFTYYILKLFYILSPNAPPSYISYDPSCIMMQHRFTIDHKSRYPTINIVTRPIFHALSIALGGEWWYWAWSNVSDVISTSSFSPSISVHHGEDVGSMSGKAVEWCHAAFSLALIHNT